jgi:hypothetical protein
MSSGLSFLCQGNVACGVIKDEWMVHVSPDSHDEAAGKDDGLHRPDDGGMDPRGAGRHHVTGGSERVGRARNQLRRVAASEMISGT